MQVRKPPLSPDCKENGRKSSFRTKSVLRLNKKLVFGSAERVVGMFSTLTKWAWSGQKSAPRDKIFWPSFIPYGAFLLSKRLGSSQPLVRNGTPPPFTRIAHRLRKNGRVLVKKFALEKSEHGF